MFGCLAVAGVGLHHPLATGSLSHQTGVGVDIAVTPTHRAVPLGSLAAGRTRLRPVTAGPVVRELHPLQTVLHHEVAVVDVGPPVGAADHVGVLVTVVLTIGQTGVILTDVPVNLQNNNRNRLLALQPSSPPPPLTLSLESPQLIFLRSQSFL